MNKKKMVFSPGCTLMMYKPKLVEKLHEFLNVEFGEMDLHTACCRNEPSSLSEETVIINVCSGCDRRFSSYDGVSTVSLWKLLAESKFPFPDYKGEEITVHDACPTRHKPYVHEAVRELLCKMNFNIIEAEMFGTSAFCCGDSFYSHRPKDEVLKQMKKRADSMPVENVAVYCVSCVKSMVNGGKTPRYMVDLIFGEPTEPGETDPDLWHESINEFASAH